MKKRIFLMFLLAFAGILSLGIVTALDISVENYYPTPVEAGDYFNIWLKVTNRETVELSKAIIKIEPKYPFSVEPGDDKEVLINNIPGRGGFVITKIRVRVDAGAKEGDNQLKLAYREGDSTNWKELFVPITVTELQTSFDVVLQELNEEGVFIAIANIGKNVANAVTVRIPEQENFRTGMVSASIVGNLESGDYTLINFEIKPKSGFQNPATSGSSAGTTPNRGTQEFTPGEEKELLIKIEYTDVLGIRRTILNSLALDPAALMRMAGGTTGLGATNGFGRPQASSSLFDTSDKWMWVSVALLVLIIAGAVYSRIKRKREM